MMVVFGAGVAMFVAAVQVYFRDLTSFLRYMMRIWLYTSPILWIPAQVPEKYQPLSSTSTRSIRRSRR